MTKLHPARYQRGSAFSDCERFIKSWRKSNHRNRARARHESLAVAFFDGSLVNAEVVCFPPQQFGQFDSLTFNWAVWITIGHQILAYARQRPELHGGAVKRPVYDGFTEASEIILQQRKNVQCLRITESRVVLDQ